MELDRISKSLRSKEGIRHLISLFPPEDSELSRAKADQYHAILEVFYRLWREFLIDGAKIPRARFELNVGFSDGPLILEGIDLWTYVLLTIASCYDYVLRKHLSLDRKEQSGLPPGLNLDRMRQLAPEDANGDPALLATARVFSYHYFQCIFTLYFTQLFRPLRVPEGPVGVFVSTYHSTVSRLFHWIVTMEQFHLTVLGQRLLASILEYAEEVFSDELPWNQEHPFGPFSAIQIRELALLAKRDPSVIRRYGDKHIAKIFENQLALVAQSLGLYVVSTRAGTQTVDLVCISSRPDERMTLLIEAKTTKATYALPTRDSRALRDYVADVRATLTTLPPLAFALIVGPRPAKTITRKIEDMEEKIGLPVRYCEAQVLANLRERIAGPLPLRIFRREILRSPKVLPGEIVDSVVDAYNMEQAAHVQLVESMFTARGIA